MRLVKCPYCAGKTSRYGKTVAGSQRWKCNDCKRVFTDKIDSAAKRLKIFLQWLLGRSVQTEMPGNGRTFRRKTAEFWHIWPLPPKIETSLDVVFIDGIYLSRKLCVLIARDQDYVIGWYVCRSENSRSWKALMERIAAPRMVVSDGGSGFQKALKEVWPQTSHQRCLFHVFSQVRRYTTSFPKTQAGRDLYRIAYDLMAVKTMDAAYAWIDRLLAWRQTYDAFLKEMTIDEKGNKRPTHERLLKAEHSMLKLIGQNTLFTFLEFVDVEMPCMNNRIEGGTNTLLRSMLRNHRGLSLERRVKAVYWWCYMHSPRPLSAAEILKCMPTDETISRAYQRLNAKNKVDYSVPQWGEGVAWNELHMSTDFPTPWD